MASIEWIFLIAVFLPGIIRGAFWYDSPSVMGVIWIFGILGFVMAVLWINDVFFENRLITIIVLTVAIIAANSYALKGSTIKLNRYN